MRFGYVKARRNNYVESFKTQVDLDDIYVDVQENSNDVAYQSLYKLLGLLTVADELILTSLDNAVNSIEELQYMTERQQAVGFKLTSLRNVDNEDFTGIQEALEFCFRLNTIVLRRNKFPDGFYKVYKAYKNRELKWYESCENLGISQGNFYSLVNKFECEEDEP